MICNNEDVVKRWDWDRIGAWASGACAVHCLLTSVAFGVLAVVGLDWLGSKTSELIFLATAVSVGALAVTLGYRRHRSWIPGLILGSGLLMVVIGHFVLGHSHAHGGATGTHHHDGGSHFLTTLFSVGGGLTLVAFHLVNARLSRCGCGHQGCEARPEPLAATELGPARRADASS